ncbi:MAG: alpha-L-fucosidase [Clostridia bacterium]|nr:alpha-L-fucosidase [Clostridia bacterium]
MLKSNFKNKFGMFIHWGLYSLVEKHEQALARYDMSCEEYEKLAEIFNPVKYDPEKWVLLAKKCGMKYICFTAKHHDGFCMWDTKQTDYNIMNTPYGKDTLKMLADACEKHGMLLSVYYSNPDWHHKYGYNPESTHQWKAKYPDVCDTEKYREFVKAQVRELLTGYGKIYSFFWDIPPKIEDASLNALVRELQPGIIINDRGWSEGDFSTPERRSADSEGKHYEYMTEACNSVGQQSWGYRRGEDFFSKRFLCCSINKYMALGASYLLNVGPDANGEISGKYEKKLLSVGDWYNRTEGCLEGGAEDDRNYSVEGNKYFTSKKNGKTYLHFYDGLVSDAIVMRNFPCLPKKVRLLNSGKELSFTAEYLPEMFTGNADSINGRSLHIIGFDSDDYADEPIIAEIEWAE